jgi:Domain of unknown function (DUF397)
MIEWRKSSYTTSNGGDCVEVAAQTPVVAVRDSKDPYGPKLTITAADWHTFMRRVKNSRHDLT